MTKFQAVGKMADTLGEWKVTAEYRDGELQTFYAKAKYSKRTFSRPTLAQLQQCVAEYEAQTYT